MMDAKYPFAMDGNEFRGKRVLVTDGTKGIGEAVVSRLTLGGGSVATTAQSPLPKGQQPALRPAGHRYASKLVLGLQRHCDHV
jgi:NAD(P)-dependent dehydrogenase (short-subunit alcohol dehydrogenase family)